MNTPDWIDITDSLEQTIQLLKRRLRAVNELIRAFENQQGKEVNVQ